VKRGMLRIGILALALALLAPAGCAPLRRGPLPPLDRTDRVVPPPSGERPVPSPAPQESVHPAWQRVDRSLPPRQLVCRLARSLEGVPYVYGGATPQGFDCSGLVQFVYREAGTPLPRTVRHQAAAGRHVARSNLLPGDLVFFRTRGRSISHVGIYVGGGRFVHAPSTGKVVRADTLDNEWLLRRYAGARRVLERERVAIP